MVLKYISGVKITAYGVLKSGCLIFVPGDLVKCVITALLGVRIIPTLKKTAFI
jgi:biotin transport system substrate-specific component